MKQFKYDIYKLLEAVQNRPCLWNRNVENYKDRIERKMAWVEIFNILDDQYESMSLDEKQLTSDIVISKWTNIRDTFIKTIRRRKGKTKKYVLYNHLKFLLATQGPEDQEQDSLECTEDQSPSKERAQMETRVKRSPDYEIQYEETNDSSDVEVTPNHKEFSNKRKRTKTDSRHEDNPNIDFVSVDDPRIMNEDEAFFASLLPTVVKYDEDERLEFRIEVLALMKKIKDRRKWSCEALGP